MKVRDYFRFVCELKNAQNRVLNSILSTFHPSSLLAKRGEALPHPFLLPHLSLRYVNIN
jgi:hypothetical protein